MTTPNNEELLARAKRLRHELGDSNSRLDRQCVTAMYEMEQALQSQAERIKELESECLNTDVRLATAIEQREQMRAAIAATEPDSYLVEGWHKGELWAKHHNFTLEEAKNSASVFTKHYTTVHTIPLFTRPMPAQDVDAGMINLPEPVAWFANYGGNVYTEAQLKQAVRDALDALKDVAQTLAWTQHGECRGFSDGLLTTDEALDKARDALSKYKGAKL